jgi:hypothetical protein
MMRLRVRGCSHRLSLGRKARRVGVKGAFLFGSAGTFQRWQGRLYILADIFRSTPATAKLSRESPELLKERKTAAKKAKPRDKIIFPLVKIVLPGIAASPP